MTVRAFTLPVRTTQDRSSRLSRSTCAEKESAWVLPTLEIGPSNGDRDLGYDVVLRTLQW